ncbi:F-box/LRR-repeat protein 12-like [Bidens hawaiensis]|uniref:F-box/LRR-repeat protein 12-like n=1 Tax=Bidens hawaiensis TaxID=980011 RepID=UPI00404A1DD7
MGVGSQSRKKRSCFTNLPDELVYQIFEKVDSNLDRESFGLTCHRFLDIQNSSLKHLELNFLPWLGNFYSEIDSLTVDKLLNRFRQLESLYLSGCDNVNDSGLVLLQKYGAKFHSLSLDSSPKITNVGFSSIASGCPSLSFIYISFSSIDDSGLEILTKSCNSLKEVSLVWCDKITDHGIQSLTRNCRQLRALRITGCTKIRGEGFKGCSSTLACLEANDCLIYAGLTEVVSGGGLEYLNLFCRWPLSIRGRALASISSGRAANLKILNLWGCSFVRNDAIIHISKGCPLLQDWNLECCVKISIAGWESTGLNCQSLEKIHVNRCLRLCDRGLLALGSGCKRLSVIYLGDFPLITPAAIQLFNIQRANVEIRMLRCRESSLPSLAFKITPPYSQDI